MKLTSMPNIGSEMEKKLQSTGIYSAEELSAMGSKEAFLRLKLKYPEVCLVHLYVLHGAINHLPYNMLDTNTKQELKEFSDRFK